MNKDILQGILFPDLEQDSTLSSVASHAKISDILKSRILNLHLHSGFPTEGKEDMPLVGAYNGPLPESFISFADRNKKLFSSGVHCFLYDYKIEPTWSIPALSVSCLKQYACVIAPDYSLFVDLPRAINVWNVYRNRWVTSYWQSQQIKVIPSASWGNADSFEYCFDGLPENSTIAIGHVAIGKDKDRKRLYRMGVESLVESKHPSRLVVYGSPLDFSPDVEVVHYDGFIQKLRNL